MVPSGNGRSDAGVYDWPDQNCLVTVRDMSPSFRCIAPFDYRLVSSEMLHDFHDLSDHPTRTFRPSAIPAASRLLVVDIAAARSLVDYHSPDGYHSNDNLGRAILSWQLRGCLLVSV